MHCDWPVRRLHPAMRSQCFHISVWLKRISNKWWRSCPRIKRQTAAAAECVSPQLPLKVMQQWKLALLWLKKSPKHPSGMGRRRRAGTFLMWWKGPWVKLNYRGTSWWVNYRWCICNVWRKNGLGWISEVITQKSDMVTAFQRKTAPVEVPVGTGQCCPLSCLSKHLSLSSWCFFMCSVGCQSNATYSVCLQVYLFKCFL